MTNKEETNETAPSKSARTCVGCQKADEREALVRLVADPDAETVLVDAAGGAFGRGVHVHPTLACLEKAVKGGFARSLKMQVRADANAIASDIRDAYARRANGLLGAASRQHKVAIGADASVAALTEDPDAVVVVANDAAHAATLTSVQNAINQGRAVVWLDRAGLGALLKREEVAVCVVTDRRIGAELVHTTAVRQALVPSDQISSSSSRGEACRSREVR